MARGPESGAYLSAKGVRLALLLDVYRPVRSNGLGIVYIAGSGWHSGLGYDARSLKDSPQVAMYREPLLEAGYTVFALNHRQASLFKYPAAVLDAQRAVRYVRFHASRFAIDRARIGLVADPQADIW